MKANDEDDLAESTPRSNIELDRVMHKTSSPLHNNNGNEQQSVGSKQNIDPHLHSMYQKVSSPLTVNSSSNSQSESVGSKQQSANNNNNNSKNIQKENDWELLNEEEEEYEDSRNPHTQSRPHTANKLKTTKKTTRGIAMHESNEYINFDHTQDDDVVNHEDQDFDHDHNHESYYEHNHYEGSAAGDILLNNSREEEEDESDDDDQQDDVQSHHSQLRAPAPPAGGKQQNLTTTSSTDFQLHHSPSRTQLLTLSQAELFSLQSDKKSSTVSAVKNTAKLTRQGSFKGSVTKGGAGSVTKKSAGNGSGSKNHAQLLQYGERDYISSGLSVSTLSMSQQQHQTLHHSPSATNLLAEIQTQVTPQSHKLNNTQNSLQSTQSSLQNDINALQHKLAQQRDMHNEEHRFKFRDENMVTVNSRMMTNEQQQGSVVSMTRKMSSTPTNVTPRGSNVGEKLKTAASAYSLSSTTKPKAHTNTTSTKKTSSSNTTLVTPIRSQKDPLPSFTSSSSTAKVNHSSVSSSGGGDKVKKSKKVIK
eukprot:gene28949-35907_t